ncbi:MAG: DUF4364 family protein [Clostridiales bacterium]|nr:DUF4364 family protein [Clostridiales bacterium]
MSHYATNHLAENKLIILYLIDKMGVPLSNSEICQFALEKGYMDYFTVQQYISELVDARLIDKTKDNNSTRYTMTDDGAQVLNFFVGRISESNQVAITTYVNENGKRIRSEYEVTANYFLELNNEYLVKCGVYESDGATMMEVNVVVPTKEQAKKVAANWKKNVNKYYSFFLESLVTGKGID